MSLTAWLFPGQGSQAVGMARDAYEQLPEARLLFAEAERITGLPIARLCFDGPAEELQRTSHAQPCLLVASAALMLPLRMVGAAPDYVAGHSVGEYTALFAAGALPFAAAMSLVYRRGQLMQGMRRGMMAAILGLDAETVQTLCTEAAGTGVVVPANYNSPSQVAISGEPDAVRLVGEAAKAAGAARVIPLHVDGAFHSPLMEPAGRDLAAAIAAAPWSRPSIPVVTNVDGEATADPCAIREKLTRQLSSSVRWTDCVQTLQARGVTRFLEIGPGRTLTGLLRQIDRAALGIAVNSVDAAQRAASGPAE